jgi:hypothetical protein
MVDAAALDVFDSGCPSKSKLALMLCCVALDALCA